MRFTQRFLRITRRAIILLASLATLLVLAVAIENWRGSRAWSRYAAEQAALGVNLLELPKPSALPAAQNFMKTPTLDKFLWEKNGSAALQTFIQEHQLPKSPATKAFGWKNGLTLDYTACLARYSEDRKTRGLPAITPSAGDAGTLLSLQKPLEPVLEELREAARSRGRSQLSRPIEIGPESPFATPVVQFVIPRSLLIAQSSHACASLDSARTDTAVLDTLAALRLCRGLADAPDDFLVETMISSVGYSIALQPVWEGLQRQSWTEVQLEALERELSQADLVQSLNRAYSNERAAALVMFDRWPVGRLLQSRRLKWLRMPRGWHEQNMISYSQVFQRVHDDLSSVGTPQFLERLSRMYELPSRAFGRPLAPYSFLAAQAVPGMRKITQNVVRNQSYLNLARVACALERHRLARGGLPESLNQLVPAYLERLPVDPIDGQPLRYRRTEDGHRFVLYSIGLDGKDDTGSATSNDKPDAAGDWCWPSLADHAGASNG